MKTVLRDRILNQVNLEFYQAGYPLKSPQFQA